MTVLRSFPGQSLSIMDLSKVTSIFSGDVTATLEMLGLLILVESSYIVCAPPDLLDDLALKYPPSGLQVDPESLHWAPLYVTDPKRDLVRRRL